VRITKTFTEKPGLLLYFSCNFSSLVSQRIIIRGKGGLMSLLYDTEKIRTRRDSQHEKTHINPRVSHSAAGRPVSARFEQRQRIRKKDRGKDEITRCGSCRGMNMEKGETGYRKNS
jgi:hypothetical protein